MPNPDWSPPADIDAKLGGKMDAISCGPQPWLGTGQPGARITADWLPFAPGTRFPLPEPGLQPPPETTDLPHGYESAIARTTENEHWELAWWAGSPSLRVPANAEAVAFSPDGRLIAVSGGSRVFVFDFISGRDIRSFRAGNPLAFSPDGRLISAGGQVFEVASCAVRHDFSRRVYAASVAFSPDGSAILFGTYNQSASVFDLATGEDIHEFECDGEYATCADFSRDGRHFLVAANTEGMGSVHVREMGTWREVANISCDLPYTARFAPDGEHVYLGEYGQFRIVNWRNGQTIRTLDAAGYGYFAASPDGRLILKSAERADDGGERATVWDTASGEVVWHFDGHVNSVVAVAISPDGTRLVTASDHSVLAIWNAATGELIRKTDQIATRSPKIAVAPHGRFFAVGNRFGDVALFDFEGNRIRELDSQTSGQGLALAFSPADAAGDVRLAVGCDGETIAVFDAETGAKLLAGPNPDERMYRLRNLQWSADGRRIFAFCEQVGWFTVDADTGHLVADETAVTLAPEFPVAEDTISVGVLSPDARLAFVATVRGMQFCFRRRE